MNMLAAVLVMDTVKLIVSLPTAYLTLWAITKLLKIRFANHRITLRITLILAVAAFLLDLLNIYVLVYAQWSNLLKLVPLLGSLILYYAFALVVIWVMYRDTHKKTIIIWLVYSAAYLLMVRAYWIYITDIMALMGVNIT